MKHAWGDWRYLELNGRIRSLGIAHPRRERVLVRKALSQLGFRYKELIPVLNPDYHGWKNDKEVSLQWLDFCVWSGKKMFVILFEPIPSHGQHPWQVASLEAKKRFLEKKGIPYIMLSRMETSQVYGVLIQVYCRKEHLA